MTNERNISDILTGLQSDLGNDRLQIGQLLEALRDRGPFFMVMLLTVPFLQPVALPGVSLPFGLLIVLLSFGILVERDVPIPKRIAAFSMNPKGVSMLFRGAIALFRRLEKWSKPRYAQLVEPAGVRRFHAVLLIAAGVLLMLPLPIPFTNSFPAYVAAFIALGYLQRDGAMLLVSYALSVATAAYFGLIAALGFEGVRLLLRSVWGS